MRGPARRALASFELLTAAGLWGFGFIATIWAFEVFSPFEMTFLRFALAATLLGFFLVRPTGRRAIRENLRIAFVPALLLTVTLSFQTWGLQYTTATKSGFITTLYVIFVPILESLLNRQRLPWSLWLCVAVALFGTGLIVNIGLDSLNIGDLLTFGCALAATVQICWLGRISPHIKRPFIFNLVQAGWGALLILPILALTPVLPPGLSLIAKLAAAGSWSAHTWWGLALLTFGSTVIAFFLQVRAQAFLSATVSSLIFLLESPFAMIFALLLLGETLGRREALGAGFIFTAAVAACLIEAGRKKITEPFQSDALTSPA